MTVRCIWWKHGAYRALCYLNPMVSLPKGAYVIVTWKMWTQCRPNDTISYTKNSCWHITSKDIKFQIKSCFEYPPLLGIAIILIPAMLILDMLISLILTPAIPQTSFSVRQIQMGCRHPTCVDTGAGSLYLARHVLKQWCPIYFVRNLAFFLKLWKLISNFDRAQSLKCFGNWQPIKLDAIIQMFWKPGY